MIVHGDFTLTTYLLGVTKRYHHSLLHFLAWYHRYWWR